MRQRIPHTYTVDQSLAEYLPTVKQTKHTRYPACETSLDDAIGIWHIKDLIAVDADDADTLSGYLTAKVGQPLRNDDRLGLGSTTLKDVG